MLPFHMCPLLRSGPERLVVVGAGRLGRAIAPALAAAGASVVGPLARGEPLPPAGGDDVILLCVPDDAVRAVAASIPRGPFVGHCAGALTLDVLGNHDAFSAHPLLAVSDGFAGFAGAACAVAGRTPAALAVAQGIARRLGMDAIAIDDELRPLYHAAASMASNYLVTLEDAAERLAAPAGVERRHLARLARSALDGWENAGGPGALTGPIARGDEPTVRRQREAVAQRAPGVLGLWDALAAATRELSARRSGG